MIRSKERFGMSYLYDNYSSALYGVILRIVSDENIAEEVLQDVFMKIWDKIGQFDPSKGRFFTWMVNISRNLSIDRLRSKELKKAEKTDAIENIVSGIAGDHTATQNEDGIGLNAIMDSLRDEEKLIVEMIYFKGYTQSEVSDEFDIPLGTVKTRLRMALKNLRKFLQVKE